MQFLCCLDHDQDLDLASYLKDDFFSLANMLPIALVSR